MPCKGKRYGRRVHAGFYQTKKKNTPLEREGKQQFQSFKDLDLDEI